MKVIFLDLDGPIFKEGRVNESSVHCLLELIRETGAKIIVTSSWRIGKSIGELKTELTNKIPEFPSDEIIGMTEVIYHKGLEIPRGAEIEIYLQDHIEIEEYVIIDDEEVPLLSQSSHFVQTWASGFIGDCYRNALRILG